MAHFLRLVFTSLPVDGRSVAINVCLSVCLSVHWRISKITFQISRDILYMLPVAVARSASDNSAIRCVLPVLWMTSCFNIMRHMSRGFGNIYLCAELQQVWISSVLSRGTTLFDFVLVYNDTNFALGRSLLSTIALFVDCSSKLEMPFFVTFRIF